MRIIGPPSVSYNTVRNNLTKSGWDFFVSNILDPLWGTALGYVIDPVGVVAQSLHETGNGKFPGNVKPWFFNTAGIKVYNTTAVKLLLNTTNDDHPLLHAQFANWEVGAEAHVQHLRAYAGWAVTDDAAIVDPRYVHLVDKKLTHFHELGGTGSWAPKAEYGGRVEAKMKEISA